MIEHADQVVYFSEGRVVDAGIPQGFVKAANRLFCPDGFMQHALAVSSDGGFRVDTERINL